MTRLLMLDSGAFGVWSQGNTIDLKGYIDFCLRYSGVSYYVNLDVIPGRPGDKRSITKAGVEESCKAGWQNYLEMIQHLPKDKVIPVFHMNDDVKWLDRMLSFGCKYVGISPANDRSTGDKLKWMSNLRRFLFDGAGRPTAKTHGFAVTSYRLMRFWQWHSVDSASWKQNAAWGSIYVPRKRGGEFDYSRDPMIVFVSPMSPAKSKAQAHVHSMTPTVKAQTVEYLHSIGLTLGEWIIKKVEPGYSPPYVKEAWYDRKKLLVLENVVPGVCGSFKERCKSNTRLFKRANVVLPVDHIYFAGSPMPYKLEYQLGRRLLCYFDIGLRKHGKSHHLANHIETMRRKDAKDQP